MNEELRKLLMAVFERNGIDPSEVKQDGIDLLDYDTVVYQKSISDSWGTISIKGPEQERIVELMRPGRIAPDRLKEISYSLAVNLLCSISADKIERYLQFSGEDHCHADIDTVLYKVLSAKIEVS